jgi:putative ABC transport system permease protein
VYQARRVDLQSTLREEGRSGSAGVGKQRFRSALVVLEIALSVVLLVGAGLMMRSLGALQRVDPGFVADHLLKVEYVLPARRYPQDFSVFPAWTEVRRFQTEARDRIARLPGVATVGLGSQHPMNPGFTNSFLIVGRESEYESQPEVWTRMVDDGYLAAAGVPLLDGRPFDARDDVDGAPVLLINRSAADRFFPDQNPLGEQIRFWGQAREIVGVVGNERFQGLGADAPFAVYAPLAQAPIGSGSILIRTSVPPTGLVAAVRAEIAAVDPDLAVFAIATMDDEVRASVARERFATTLLALFAATGLLLALVGVHGLLSYTVAQRTRELGIRMALGASRGEVLRMVVGRGLTLAVVGLALGLLGAVAAAGALRGMLFGVGTTDPVTLAVVAGSLLLTALFACLSPARRATAADPMHALRAD